MLCNKNVKLLLAFGKKVNFNVLLKRSCCSLSVKSYIATLFIDSLSDHKSTVILLPTFNSPSLPIEDLLKAWQN